ncbi:unnamed protein product [Urochloa humidicola]
MIGNPNPPVADADADQSAQEVDPQQELADAAIQPMEHGTTHASTSAILVVPLATTQFDEINLKKEQDSPDHSLFSYPIEEFLNEEEEEISSTDASAALPSNDVKSVLQSILPLLDKPVDDLVQDAELIRSLYQQVKGRLPPEVETALIPAAFFESRQPQVLQARKRIADRARQT